jgi:hypothetical protein
MTTPAQAALAEPQPPAPAAADPLEKWFDAKLRPVLLERLAAADGAAATAAVQAHNTALAAIEYRLQSYGNRYGSASQETREAVAAIVSELQSMIDDGRPR